MKVSMELKNITLFQKSMIVGTLLLLHLSMIFFLNQLRVRPEKSIAVQYNNLFFAAVRLIEKSSPQKIRTSQKRTPEPTKIISPSTSDSPDRSAAPLAGQSHGEQAPHAPHADRPGLDLRIQRSWITNDQPTVQELVRSDPRANSVKPTVSEQFALRLGTLECIFQERLPDGKIYRGPGRLVSVQNLHNAVTGGNKSAKACVRFSDEIR